MSPRQDGRRLGAVLLIVVIGCRGEAAPGAGRATAAADAGVDAAPVIAACGATDPVVAEPDALALVQTLRGEVHFALSEPPTRRTPIDRAELASPTATITAVTFTPVRVVEGAPVPLTDAELERVIFRGTVLRLRSFGQVVEHRADDCAFTLRELIRAIEATELRARGANRWSPEIDLHHVQFWGLTPSADGTWRVGWAS